MTKAKKTGDSWKQQRQAKRTNLLEHATAQIAADKRGDTTAKRRERYNETHPGQSRKPSPPSKTPDILGPLGRAAGTIPDVATWIAGPPRPGPLRQGSTVLIGPGAAAAAQTKAAAAKLVSDTAAALAAHGYKEPKKKTPAEKKRKMPGAGR